MKNQPGSLFAQAQSDDFNRANALLKAEGFGEKCWSVFLYLLPGIVVYGLINVEPVWQVAMKILPLDPRVYQYGLIVVFTFGWHIGVPVFSLRRKYRQSWRQILGVLGFSNPGWRNILLFLPVVIVGFTVLSVPYMKYVFPGLSALVSSIPGLAIPSWSLFKDAGLYDFAWPFLVIMLIGNFVGEEVYFRGYLMKRTSFLGSWNAVASSVLFSVYHLWQAPTTWALALPALIFGSLMVWKKNLWLCIILHLYLNLFWGGIVQGLVPILP